MATKKFTDIDPLFLVNPLTGDVGVKNDTRAISFAIKNLILTMNGERPFNSDIGTPVKKLLFELSGPQLQIILEQMIQQTIYNFEPRAEVLNVTARDSSDNNSVYVMITYKVKNTEQSVQVEIALERTR